MNITHRFHHIRRGRQTVGITVMASDDGGVRRLVRAAQAALAVGQRLTGRGLTAIRFTKDRTADATTTLQALPDATLLGLAAASAGMGTGFYLARKPRLVVALGVVPALLTGVAIALRPVRPASPAPDTTRHSDGGTV